VCIIPLATYPSYAFLHLISSTTCLLGSLLVVPPTAHTLYAFWPLIQWTLVPLRRPLRHVCGRAHAYRTFELDVAVWYGVWDTSHQTGLDETQAYACVRTQCEYLGFGPCSLECEASMIKLEVCFLKCASHRATPETCTSEFESKSKAFQFIYGHVQGLGPDCRV